MDWLLVQWLLVAGLALLVLLLSWRLLRLHGQLERRAYDLFAAWRAQEQAALDLWRQQEMATYTDQKAQLLFQDWQQSEERRIRDEAIRQSEAVVRGKVTEHLLPFFPTFQYNPRDARFLGTPVDLVVFDGLSEGNLRQVVFVEVKTGKAANLSDRERQVKGCIEQGRVSYHILYHEP